MSVNHKDQNTTHDLTATNTATTTHHTTSASTGKGGGGGGGGGGKGNKVSTTKDNSSSDNRHWKKDNRQTPNSKSKASYHSSSGTTSPPNGSYSSRYYYREMPPRFQSHNKKSNNSSNTKNTTSTSKSQGTKKQKDSHSRWPSSSNNSVATSDNSWLSATSPNHSISKGGGVNESVWGSTSNNNTSELWSSSLKHNHWMSDDGEESLSNSDPIIDEIPNDLDSFSNDKIVKEQRSKQHSKPSDEDDISKLSSGAKKGSPDTRQEVQSPESLDSETGQEIGGVWRSSRNSMGSTSSVGSNSSWKGSNNRLGGNSGSSSYQQRSSTSPRKQMYSTHRSVSVSSNSNSNGRSSSNRFGPKKKPVMDLDDAMESLHGEPSGWGDLPSPKQSGIDMGTEVWGIPDDVKQKMKKERGTTWGEGSNNDWIDDRSTNGSGWIDHSGHDNFQWGGDEASNETGWNIVKGKDQTDFGDKVKILVDMGFSPSSCEKALKLNNENFEAALGDLLAITAIKENEGTFVTSSSITPPTQRPTLTVTGTVSSSTGPNITPQVISPPSTALVQSTNTTTTTINTNNTLTQTTGLDLVNLQQILGQQLTQHRLLKQKFMIQMSQLKSTALTTQQLQKQQQFLTANLNQVNAHINTVYPQYVAITKLIQQKTPSSIDDNNKDTSKEVPPQSDVLQASNDISTSLQSMSLEQTDITKSSARTLSRLQQIISGNSQENENDDYNNESEITPVTTSPIETPPIAPPTPSSVTSSSFSSTSSRFSTVRSVDEIPEFKPGVPWNPHGGGHTDSKQSASIPSTPSEYFYESNYHSSRASTPGYGGYSGSGSGYSTGYEQSRGVGFPGPFNRSTSYNGTSNSSIGGYRGGFNSAKTINNFNGTKLPPTSPQQGGYMSSSQPGGIRTHHRGGPRLTTQNSYNGPFSVTSGSTVGYRSANRGQYNTAVTPGAQAHHGGKWSFDGNPWGMPPTSGSIWSMESSDSILNSTAVGGGTGYTEWRNVSGGRKPSLPLQLSAPTNYILLKNVTTQIDETSLREVCSEYGHVLSCSINPFNDSVLIRYSSKDEAALAKAGLEKNPSICGVYVSPSFASEMDIASFTNLRTPSHHSLSLSSALEITSPSWLPTQPSIPKKAPPTSLWGSEAPPTGGVVLSGDSSSGSVWSNGGNSGTLVGLTNSPWSISPPQQQQQVPNVSQDDGTTLCSTSPPLSTFLPNGLF